MWRLGEGLDKEVVCHLFYSFTKEALEGFEDFQLTGQEIRNVKYVYELVLLAREETVLQNMTDRLNKTGEFYEMEMNLEKTNIMRNSRKPF